MADTEKYVKDILEAFDAANEIPSERGGQDWFDALEVKEQETHPPEMNFYRIEALRAASRIVAGIYAGAECTPTMGAEFYSNLTIERAEQFARWLETGER